MKIQQLRFFVAVVEEGGIVKAAERLRLSQPTLSAGLKALEAELGNPMFERTEGRRSTATPRALEFYKSAVDILRRCDEARRQYRTDVRPARLRIGVLPTIAGYMIQSFVSSIVGNDEAARLQLWEGSPRQLADWMRDGRIDACWTTVAEDGDCAQALWREPYVAIVSTRHRFCLDGRSSISLADLNGEPIVLRGSCEMPRRRLWSDNVKPKIVARVDCDDKALRLVAAGLCLAIAPKSLATSDVVALVIRDLNATRSIGLAWRPELGHVPVKLLIAAASELTWHNGRQIQESRRSSSDCFGGASLSRKSRSKT